MSDPTNLSPHSDLRGPDLDFKRSRDHVSKWKYGWTEQNTGTKCGYAYGGDPQPDKDEREGRNIVPRVIAKDTHHAHNSNKGRFTNNGSWPASSGFTSRIASLHHAKMDAKYPDLDLDGDMQALSSTDIEALSPADAEILYSYDRDASPASALGLGDLVTKAEAEFNNKETEKIVREYEVLDQQGEKVVQRRRAGRGKRASESPEVGAERKEDVDGDWEAI